MDRKTLEYMERRAKQGREIANKIDELKEKLEHVSKIGRIEFSDKQNNHKFTLHPGYNNERIHHKRIIDEIQAFLEKAISDEIARLEQELADL